MRLRCNFGEFLSSRGRKQNARTNGGKGETEHRQSDAPERFAMKKRGAVMFSFVAKRKGLDRRKGTKTRISTTAEIADAHKFDRQVSEEGTERQSTWVMFHGHRL